MPLVLDRSLNRFKSRGALAASSSEGLKDMALEEELPRSSDMSRAMPGDFTDAEELLDVARQFQQAENRVLLKTVVEGNRGPSSGSRSSAGGKGGRDTVASLRQAMSQRRASRLASGVPGGYFLTSVSEYSSGAELPAAKPVVRMEPLQAAEAWLAGQEGQAGFSRDPTFYSATTTRYPQSDRGSSVGAPASGEDDLSAFMDGSTGDEQQHGQAQEAELAGMLSEDKFATNDELAAVLACLRRVERKVEWMMVQERKGKAGTTFSHTVTPLPLSVVIHRGLWLPFKNLVARVWVLNWLLPVMDLVERFAGRVTL